MAGLVTGLAVVAFVVVVLAGVFTGVFCARSVANKQRQIPAKKNFFMSVI